MEVTDVRLNMLNKDGGVKAIGSFSLDNSFAVRGIRVMEDKNGRNFVAFPSRAKTNGEYEDVAFPLSKGFYKQVTDAILEAFHSLKETKSEEQTKGKANDTPFTDEAYEQMQEKQTPKKGKGR